MKVNFEPRGNELADRAESHSDSTAAVCLQVVTDRAMVYGFDKPEYGHLFDCRSYMNIEMKATPRAATSVTASATGRAETRSDRRKRRNRAALLEAG